MLPCVEAFERGLFQVFELDVYFWRFGGGTDCAGGGRVVLWWKGRGIVHVCGVRIFGLWRDLIERLDEPGTHYLGGCGEEKCNFSALIIGEKGDEVRLR